MPTISLRITDEQKQRWIGKAEGQPLSDWIKGRCDQDESVPKAILPEKERELVESYFPATSKDEDIARKSGHAVGCDCQWVCTPMRKL